VFGLPDPLVPVIRRLPSPSGVCRDVHGSMPVGSDHAV
jgi:hypothetical protein